MRYISFHYISFFCKRNVISYLLDSCENFDPETGLLNCTVVFTLLSRRDESRTTRLQRRQEKSAVNVWTGDASIFTSVLLPFQHFSFSLFICKTKRKKLFTLLQYVENKHILYSVTELASYGQTLLLGLV